MDDPEAAPPGELRLAWLCKRWGALPIAGAMADQDYRTIHTMTVLDSVHATLSRLRNLSGKQIHTLTNGERRLIRWLMDERIWTPGGVERD